MIPGYYCTVVFRVPLFPLPAGNRKSIATCKTYLSHSLIYTFNKLWSAHLV